MSLGQWASLGRNHGQRPSKNERIPAVITKDNSKKKKAALRIWQTASPAAGTPVEIYLKSRGLHLQMPSTITFHPVEGNLSNRGIAGPIPDSIRYHPACPHPYKIGLHRAMVARVSINGETGLCGVHNTFLNEDGTKADLNPNRIMRGRIKRGGVWLADYACAALSTSGLVNLQIPELHEGLIIGEGIESTLSLMQITDRHSGKIIIGADNDDPGRNAAHKAANRFCSEGHDVQVLAPHEIGKDWNDFIQKSREAT